MRKNKTQKQLKKIFLLPLFLAVFSLGFLAFSAEASAATYYIAPNGSNSNLGTQLAPWRTIQYAADMVSEGDTVIVKQGTYYETVTMKTSGNASSRITFQGEDGAIVDGSQSVSGWTDVSATYGQGVYKLTSGLGSGNRAYVMTYLQGGEVKKIPVLLGEGSSDNWYDFIGRPANYMHSMAYLNNTVVNYWDGIEAWFYSNANGDLYVRFKNYDDPRMKTLRIGYQEGCFSFNNKDYISINNFHIRGCWWGVLLDNYSNNNIVDGNTLTISGQRVRVQGNSANNIISNNTMYWPTISTHTPGAWDQADEFYPDSEVKSVYASKENVYERMKREGSGTAWGCYPEGGVLIESAGSGNEVFGNNIYNMICGVSVRGTSDAKIHHNTIHGLSSSGVTYNEYVSNIEIYDNLIYDVNYGIRVLFNPNSSNSYIYRNRFWNRRGLGSFFYGYATSYVSNYTFNLWIYNNSISGASGIGWTAGMENSNLEGVRYINNIFSTPRQSYDYRPTYADLCAYNWIGGNQSLRGCDAGTNIYVADGEMWNTAARPEFNILDSSAINAGIDISQPFTINGTTYSALPGFSPGYFDPQSKPDMGAVQSGGIVDSPADINSDGRVNIKDIQACIKAIVAPDSISETYLSNCKKVAPPIETVNIKDIQMIIRKIINPN